MAGEAALIIHGGKFQADFFRNFKIQAFEYDQETLDARSEFIGELIESFMTSGFDPQKPIIVSMNEDDPSITGIILDGRHRSITWQAMRNRGLIPSMEEAKKDPEKMRLWMRYLPKIQQEYVTDIEMVIARQAFYDLHNQTKNAVFSRKRAHKNIKRLIKEHKGITTLDEAITFMISKGFTNRKVVETVWIEIQKESVRKPQKPTKNRFASVKSLFGVKSGDDSVDNVPESERVKISHGTVETKQGLDTKYFHCPCGNSFAYFTKEIELPDKSKVTALEQSPEIVSKMPQENAAAPQSAAPIMAQH